MEPEISAERTFAPAILPWVVAAVALLVYLITLNPLVSFASLLSVAKVAGWTWQPELYGPLLWLVTYPFRWLPPAAIPLALNAFSAVCAALTLALLARSVALLPHDRTEEQRLREQSPLSLLSLRAAWLPPLLAVLVCGLQLSFWENATAATGEMFDLLVFAYVVRCLLEFRIDEQEPWLTRGALVCGLGMANNWAMVGFFPLFVVALVWIKGLRFFNSRFLARMTLWGLAGLSLYLLLPLVNSLGNIAPCPFWLALKTNLVAQKGILSLFYTQGRQTVLLLSLTSLLPVFILAIRWASYFGDSSRLGVALATFMFHVVHALFLAACIWVALDPPLSPRNKGFGVPFLTFYYLGALSVGYFSGYFLLVFGGQPSPPKRVPVLLRLINGAVVLAVWGLLLLAPTLLVYRNLPQILVTNGPIYRQFATLLAQGLPPQGAVVLSDDPRRLMLLETLTAQTGAAKKYLFLDTGSLRWPPYHRYLKQRLPRLWPVDVPKQQQTPFGDPDLVRLVADLAVSNAICYLHPSFGYYFEFFHLEPHGLAFTLLPYPTNSIADPPLTPSQIQDNETFWAEADIKAIKPLLAAITSPAPKAEPSLMDRLRDRFMARAHLVWDANRDATVLATFYSRGLDYWGVQMQRAGQLAKAQAHFERALELNADNIAARVNLDCSRNLQTGRKPSPESAKSIEDRFGKYRSWPDLLRDNWPFDDPDFCFAQGQIFFQGRLLRQAAHEFERAKTLAPANLAAHLWLAQLYVLGPQPQAALNVTAQIHTQPDLKDVLRTNRNALLMVETSAHLAAKDLAGAGAAVHAALEQCPANEAEGLLATAARVYINYSYHTNALAFLDEQLKINPDNLGALVNKGYVCLQIGAYAQGIPPLTRALLLETNNTAARFNRAILYLRSGDLEAAQRDYEILQQSLPKAYPIYYGLGEIAYQRKDTNAAVRNYQLYLTNAPPGSSEAEFVSARLAELLRPSGTNRPATAAKPAP